MYQILCSLLLEMIYQCLFFFKEEMKSHTIKLREWIKLVCWCYFRKIIRRVRFILNIYIISIFKHSLLRIIFISYKENNKTNGPCKANN